MNDHYLLSALHALKCDCTARGDRRFEEHTESCACWACWSCAALTNIGQEHLPECEERCPHCGSEGPDNDHRDGCPTLGTCAQTHPRIPREEGWHYDPPTGPDIPTRWRDADGKVHWVYSEWIDEHLATHHPNARLL